MSILGRDEEPDSPDSSAVSYEISDDPSTVRTHLVTANERGRSLAQIYTIRWQSLVESTSNSVDTAEDTGIELKERYEQYWQDRVKCGFEDAATLKTVVDERTVNVNENLDEDAFFSTVEGHTTITNRYDLEKAVPMEKKRHFEEIERYWVNKPYSFITIFHSTRDNETKYYVIEPYLTPIENDLKEFLSEKLRTAIKYQSEDVLVSEGADRASVIERETRRLLERYGIYSSPAGTTGSSQFGNGGATTDEENEVSGISQRFANLVGRGSGGGGGMQATRDRLGWVGDSIIDATQIDTSQLGDWVNWGASEAEGSPKEETGLTGISVRPEPILLEEDDDTLSEYQVEKLLYPLKRDFVGYEYIDSIKHDINIEEITCNGYNSPVFVSHTEYEWIITNVYHGEDELDEFIVKLAQRSGKGISKRQPQVDATLPDGSRSQLTLGREVSGHGTNYTIRQFQEIPNTPIDLINWRTFSLDQMAFLWLAIENNKSLIFAGGTASGKTTSLNAVSLFIPSNTKIVSIEDTREVELPQRNWTASVTRPSFSDDDQGDIDEFDLLEAALRQRPEYIVMGEVRGEEGRDLFQVMSTGHTTYTTFHADSVGEVLKRFTTDPINVSKTMFTALDLVSIQVATRVQGQKVRKSRSITEINEYSAENDEINVQDIYQWRAETDEFHEVGRSNVLDQIIFDNGWSQQRLDEELFKRRVVLAYLIREGLNKYVEVAGTIQVFAADPDMVLALMAEGTLADRLEDLRKMETVDIDIAPEKEKLMPRPDPDEQIYDLTAEILSEAEERLFPEYEDHQPSIQELEEVLPDTEETPE